MRLHSFAIENHSRIRDVKVSVREHLVVIGANDVGKTSLLRSLNFLFGSSVQQLYQGLSIEDIADPALPMVVRAVLADFTEDERALFPDEISISPDRSESLTVELIVEANDEDSEQISVRRIFPEGGGRAPSRDQLQAFGWQYLPANRGASADFMEGRRSPLKAMLASADLGSDEAELASTLEAFNIRLDNNEALIELRSKLAEHLSRSMPRAIGMQELTLRTTTDPTTDVLDEVALFLKRDDTVKALGEQSDGVRQLMTMTFFDLAQSAANMVAVDEPELHLHASSQRTVAELFAQGRNQRLLVTHSPYIVQRFEPRHVLVVTSDRSVRQLPEASFSAVDKERANWWSPHLLEALTARHVLIVEGAADKAFVEACSRVMGVSLDRLGVSVLDLGGAEKFSHVYRLLGQGGFDLNLIGLVDHAERGKWVSALGAKPADINKKTLFVSNPDLEAEYAQGMTGPVAGKALIKEGVCKKEGLLNAASVEKLSRVSDESLASFARGRKVLAAVAVGKHVTPEQISTMPAISGLMTYLGSL